MFPLSAPINRTSSVRPTSHYKSCTSAHVRVPYLIVLLLFRSLRMNSFHLAPRHTRLPRRPFFFRRPAEKLAASRQRSLNFCNPMFCFYICSHDTDCASFFVLPRHRSQRRDHALRFQPYQLIFGPYIGLPYPKPFCFLRSQHVVAMHHILSPPQTIPAHQHRRNTEKHPPCLQMTAICEPSCTSTLLRPCLRPSGGALATTLPTNFGPSTFTDLHPRPSQHVVVIPVVLAQLHAYDAFDEGEAKLRCSVRNQVLPC